jgi:hypothetical protein
LYINFFRKNIFNKFLYSNLKRTDTSSYKTKFNEYIFEFLYFKTYFNACNKNLDTPPPRDDVNPCIPSPCGPNSQCKQIGSQAACSCKPNYIGQPPNCRPECTINAECPSNLACINERCKDPCYGSCGQNALCSVVNHNAICSCLNGYEGDPTVQCNLIVYERKNFSL